jgi:hypothetical protein
MLVKHYMWDLPCALARPIYLPLQWGDKLGLNGVELCHYVVLFVKQAEFFSYVFFIDGGRVSDFFYTGYEARRFDLVVLISLVTGQCLVWAVYYRIGVDGVNYGAQMVRSDSSQRALSYSRPFHLLSV